MQGKVSRKNPHVIASDTEGKWEPEDGYDWINPNNLNDKSVRWVPGIPSTRYPHVIASAVEGQWRPADGYAWAANPQHLGDMRVIVVVRRPTRKSIRQRPRSTKDLPIGRHSNSGLPA
jgi:hypothetical protein